MYDTLIENLIRVPFTIMSVVVSAVIIFYITGIPKTYFDSKFKLKEQYIKLSIQWFSTCIKILIEHRFFFQENEFSEDSKKALKQSVLPFLKEAEIIDIELKIFDRIFAYKEFQNTREILFDLLMNFLEKDYTEPDYKFLYEYFNLMSQRVIYDIEHKKVKYQTEFVSRMTNLFK